MFIMSVCLCVCVYVRVCQCIYPCPLRARDLKQACSRAVCNKGDYLLDYSGFPSPPQFSHLQFKQRSLRACFTPNIPLFPPYFSATHYNVCSKKTKANKSIRLVHFIQHTYLCSFLRDLIKDC